MIQMSFINPLSDEGKQIVREEGGDLDRIFDENLDLIDTASSISAQEISDDAFIPRSYVDMVIKRVEWYVEKKSDLKYNHKKYAFLFHPQINKFDLISFYILCQAVGVKFGPNSRESRAVVEIQGQIIENRLEELSSNKRIKEEIIQQIMNELIAQDRIKWTLLEDLLSSKKINMQDLVLKDGYVILEREEFLDEFQNLKMNRNPEKMYNVFIGNRIKELIIIKMIMQNTENYIKSVYEKSNMIEPNPTLLEIADRVSEALSKEIKFYKGNSGVGSAKASPLTVELFPPCVKDALNGIKSGGRNEVIVLFLTPFLSYARLNPSVFGSNTTLKVSDVDPNLDITRNEILPLIYDAADRCSPPLFDDQPQEKVNINAKLGFGMHSELNLQHEGETKWYTPMSCDKVKMNMPALCKPDEVCRRLKEINPLFYYIDQMKNGANLSGSTDGEPKVVNP
ncbi:MAG: DNA primase [Methanobacterium sp.]